MPTGLAGQLTEQLRDRSNSARINLPDSVPEARLSESRPRRLNLADCLPLRLYVLFALHVMSWRLARQGLGRAIGALRASATSPALRLVLRRRLSETDFISRVKDALQWAVRHSLVPGTCVQVSLAACLVLRRCGVQAGLCVGVRDSAAFEAHAWIECGGSAVIDPDDLRPEWMRDRDHMPFSVILRI